MHVTKENNQHYGKFFESAVNSCINGVEEYYSDFNFSPEDIEKMKADAKKCADYINGTTCKWVGKHTISEDCDIIVDGNRHIELKYVSQGHGTYHNTSIYYFKDFGFDFKDYMTKAKLYEAIESIGFTVSREKASPVDIPISEKIRHEYNSQYKKVVIPAEELARSLFISDIVEYLNNNPIKKWQFISDMLSKKTTSTKSKAKRPPDEFIVYNYETGKISTINLGSQIDKGNLNRKKKSIKIDKVRISIGWQNGNGLCNPTLRVFLEA